MNSSTPQQFRVAALYRFCRLDHFETLRAPLAAFCCGRGIKGTLLLAAKASMAPSPATKRRFPNWSRIFEACRNSPGWR